jgi:hypothetical protein
MAAGWNLTPGLMVQQYATATRTIWTMQKPRCTEIRQNERDGFVVECNIHL